MLLRRLLNVFRRTDEPPSCTPPINTAAIQKSLMMQYRTAHRTRAMSRPAFEDVGFRVHSQHEEDGILLYIFSLIGILNRRCIEFAAGNGIECNTANLILNHRWIGLLCDADEEKTAVAREFYGRHPDSRYWPPTIITEWLTQDNVNDVIRSVGLEGEVDLLSIDVDGVDYWLWKAIECVRPSVVVTEFNHLWGPTKAMTVPYDDDFQAEFTAHGTDYAGASLQAFVRLGRAKGYRLVGTNTIATNAFFLRDDIQCDWLPAIDPEECFDHPRARFGIEHRLPGVKDKPWVEV